MSRMRWVRVWLPVGIIVAGMVMIAATGGSIEGWEGGGAMIGAGLSVWMLNFFFRVGVAGDRERDAEDRARAYYDEHGHWPDEAPPEDATEGPAPDPHRRGRSPHDADSPPHEPPGHAPHRRSGRARRPRRP